MKFVFVVGVGRSGTSLLQAMLNSHPDIGFLPETLFARQYVFTKSGCFDRPLSKEDLINNSRLCEVFGGKQEVLTFLDEQSDFSALEIYQNLHTHLNQDQRIWSGDKDPRLLEKVQNILACYPDAKIIQIVRDPRDIICSKLKADWAKKRPWWLHALITTYQSKFYCENSENHCRIFYEDLLANPEVVLNRICQFLELDYDPAMLNYTNSAKSLMRDSERSWKENTTKNLMKSNSGNWHTDLSDFQIGFVETLCLQSPWLKARYMSLAIKLPMHQRATIAIARLALFCASKIKRMF